MVFGFAKWIKSLVLTLRLYVGTLRSADGNVALIPGEGPRNAI